MKIKITALDRLFSQYIRERANWKCERCGRDYSPNNGRLHCSHFHGRRKKSVRWEPENAMAACFTCHQWLTENPEGHTAFFKKRLGEKRFNALLIQANTPKKPDLLLIGIQLRHLLKKLIAQKSGSNALSISP